MADIELVIKIPEDYYKVIKEIPVEQSTADMLIIRCGTPLQKGHGALKDTDALMKLYGLENATKYGNETAEQQTYSYSTMMMYEIADMLDNAPTIIEADKAESEE